ncbi:MAG: hypothetical protein AMXMBFR58_13090 [Phycisphaerae bacterium]
MIASLHLITGLVSTLLAIGTQCLGAQPIAVEPHDHMASLTAWKSFPKETLSDVFVDTRHDSSILYTCSHKSLHLLRDSKAEWEEVALPRAKAASYNHRFFLTRDGEVVVYSAATFGLRRLNQFSIEGKLTGSIDLTPIVSNSGDFSAVVPFQRDQHSPLTYFVFGAKKDEVYAVDLQTQTMRRLPDVPSPSTTRAMATMPFLSLHRSEAALWYGSGRKLVQFDCSTESARSFAVDEAIRYISSLFHVHSSGDEVKLLAAGTIDKVVEYRFLTLTSSEQGTTVETRKPEDDRDWNAELRMGSIAQDKDGRQYVVRFDKTLQQSGIAGGSGMSHVLTIVDLDCNALRRTRLSVSSKLDPWSSEVVQDVRRFLNDDTSADVIINCGDSLFLIKLAK